MSDELQAAMERAARCCSRDAAFAPPQRRSRRRRLWEFEGHAHCPVVGVCLPIDLLRGLTVKVKGKAVADDYELHCDAMAQCKQRTALAEALQKDFDRRYALALRKSDQAKTTDTLAAWWRQHRDGDDLPGAVWATLTHSQCTHTLEHQVLGDVHMLQHQVGVAQRIDRARHAAALDEISGVRRELGALQLRHQQQIEMHARCAEDHEAALLQARAQSARRDAENAALRVELAQAQQTLAELDELTTLSRENALHRLRISELELALARSRQDVERRRARTDIAVDADACVERPDADGLVIPTPGEPTPPVLEDRAVLCVGGRTASVPLYRHIVERTGGRFLHHDGGQEQSVARLDSTLASADLVICQTGCISHDAYWRVKDHCKRTGKPCVFVDNPGTASLRRALAELGRRLPHARHADQADACDAARRSAPPPNAYASMPRSPNVKLA